MRYRMIALDVDGTLLTDRYELTARTKEAVRRAHEQGATIVLCTGRSPSNTIPLLEQLGLEGTLISHNGAATVRSTDRSIVNQYAFDVEQLKPLLAFCREHDIHYDVCTPFDLYVEAKPAERMAAIYRKFMLEPIVVENMMRLHEPPVKMTLCDEKEKLDALQEQLQTKVGSLTLIRSGDLFIDIMHPEATKGHALRQLAASLRIPHEQIMAVGNYFNDLEMIELAGLGIAMDNSPDGVKRQADVVAPSNNEDGVAIVIEQYCLQHTDA